MNGEAASLWGRKSARAERQQLADSPKGATRRATPKRKSAPASVPGHKTVLLIDDVRLRRECLTQLLSAELPSADVVAVGRARPWEARRAGAPDLVLIISPPLGEPPIDEIVASVSGASLLLLSDSESDTNIDAEAEFGVAGSLPANCGAPLLIAAIQLVLAGGRVHIPAHPTAVSQPHVGGRATV
jgi:DNA-binding NarL/FixJ family response regulator